MYHLQQQEVGLKSISLFQRVTKDTHNFLQLIFIQRLLVHGYSYVSDYCYLKFFYLLRQFEELQNKYAYKYAFSLQQKCKF